MEFLNNVVNVTAGNATAEQLPDLVAAQMREPSGYITNIVIKEDSYCYHMERKKITVSEAIAAQDIQPEYAN